MDSELKLQGHAVKDFSNVRDPGFAWIDAHWEDLPENEWVAANSSGIVAHNLSLDDLLDELERNGMNKSDFAVSFVTR